MIELNLLPEQYRKKRIDLGETFQKYRTLVIPGVLAIIAVIVIISLLIIVYPKLQRMTLNKLSTRWKGLEKDYEEVVKIKKEQKRLQELLDYINEITKSRILWAKRLNDISDSLPSEIQLTELTTKTEKSKDKPERTMLVISGIVPAYPGERAIGDFIKGLRENPDFMKDFPQIDPPSTETTPEGFKKFTMKCHMKPQITQIKSTAATTGKKLEKMDLDEIK